MIWLPFMTARNMKRGEVWLWDCGMVEKERPVLILSVPFGDADRAVVTVVFHSTALRGSEYEVTVSCPFLKPGAFVCQSLATYPTTRAIRKLGLLQPMQLEAVQTMVFKWQGRLV
jgi:mRNA interferase MazF